MPSGPLMFDQATVMSGKVIVVPKRLDTTLYISDSTLIWVVDGSAIFVLLVRFNNAG